MNIIARKPRVHSLVKSTDNSEYIVVDRGPGHMQQFVVGTATAHSLSYGEWFWGHYFDTMEAAMEYFNAAA